MKRKINYIVSSILVFLSFLIFYGKRWFFATFDDLALDEIFFHLKVPLKGSNTDFVLEFIKGPFLKALLVTVFIVLFVAVFLYLIKKSRLKMKFKNYFLYIPAISLLIVSTTNTMIALDAHTFILNNLDNSTFYDDNYVEVDDELLTFPEEKRNLIYIFVESYEATFTSINNGGALKENLFGDLIDIADNNVNFSHNLKIGGATPATGTGWTVGGMVAQTSGVHLKLPIDGNSYGEFQSFLPGVTSIGDILENHGYNQTLFIGSDADFGGRSNYFTQHGNYEIKDYKFALDTGLIPEDYHEWWGYEDQKLFEFAKKDILELSKEDKPFNFTMLTADTHHVDGYLGEDTEELFDEQYKNVIFNTSKQLLDFIAWAQKQDFYENTTIVIAGDHNTMDAGFIERNVESDFERRIFNLFLNAPLEAVNQKNRLLSPMDFFPTTLASLGVEIDGERIALGTNLFSKKETLFEEYGVVEVNQELAKSSRFYSNNILQ